jgi:hypothetical protein
MALSRSVYLVVGSGPERLPRHSAPRLEHGFKPDVRRGHHLLSVAMNAVLITSQPPPSLNTPPTIPTIDANPSDAVVGPVKSYMQRCLQAFDRAKAHCQIRSSSIRPEASCLKNMSTRLDACKSWQGDLDFAQAINYNLERMEHSLDRCWCTGIAPTMGRGRRLTKSGSNRGGRWQAAG